MALSQEPWPSPSSGHYARSKPGCYWPRQHQAATAADCIPVLSSNRSTLWLDVTDPRRRVSDDQRNHSVESWLPCQAPGVIGSVLGLVGPVSVYCDWVRWKI